MKTLRAFLDEVSRDLLDRYNKKASDDLWHGRPDGGKLRPWYHAATDAEGERFRKRNRGIGLARGKLGRFDGDKVRVRATEDVELDEARGESYHLRRAEELRHKFANYKGKLLGARHMQLDKHLRDHLRKVRELRMAKRGTDK